jgi:hypothetical protein
MLLAALMHLACAAHAAVPGWIICTALSYLTTTQCVRILSGLGAGCYSRRSVVPALLWFCACSTRLGWIVIYLIVIEVIVGLLEILGLFGVVGEH